MREPISPLSIISALALAGLTIGVFAIQASSSGPENAVKRLHMSILGRNGRDVVSQFLPDHRGDNSMAWLVDQAAYHLSRGTSFEVRPAEMLDSGVAQVITVYTYSNGGTAAMVWRLRRINRSWRIDPVVSQNLNLFSGV
ncbi:MAG: hypothetical protein JNM85_04730 [Chthonomonas sp.]|nr:hypothetical protein [Chthonomonas sp.]